MTVTKSPSGKGGSNKLGPNNGTRGRGRPKGVPNKTSAQLKGMILAALDQSGGVDYLMERANDPRTASAFLTLVGKVLPMTVAGDAESPVKVEFTGVK